MASIIVEGFPRSGTTFLHELLTKGFPNYDVYYSEHAASKLTLDNVFVVIRNPYESIFSWKNYIGKNENVNDIAKWYIRYSNAILENIDNVTVIDFDEMITDPTKTLNIVSDKMGIAYTPVDISKIEKAETGFDYSFFVNKYTKEAYQIYKQLLKYT
jgi:hypothetical protein